MILESEKRGHSEKIRVQITAPKNGNEIEGLGGRKANILYFNFINHISLSLVTIIYYDKLNLLIIILILIIQISSLIIISILIVNYGI